MTIQQQLDAAQNEIVNLTERLSAHSTLSAENTRLAADLKAAQTALDKSQTDLKSANDALALEKEKATKAEAALDAKEKDVENRANKRALEVIASAGAGSMETKGQEKPASDKPDLKTLKGREHFRAAIRIA